MEDKVGPQNDGEKGVFAAAMKMNYLQVHALTRI